MREKKIIALLFKVAQVFAKKFINKFLIQKTNRTSQKWDLLINLLMSSLLRNQTEQVQSETI